MISPVTIAARRKPITGLFCNRGTLATAVCRKRARPYTVDPDVCSWPKEHSMSAPNRKLVHSDIKPENTPELASRYLDVPNMPWEATKFPGIQIKVLYSDDSGITTALFKLAPGAVVPLHEHTALEQTYVLEGTIEDHEG